MSRLTRTLATLAAGLIVLPLLAACGHQQQGADPDPGQVDAVTPPKIGACRRLTTSDIDRDSNATRIVPCASDHTAQTYAVGPLPDTMHSAAYDSPDVAAYAFRTCTDRLQRYLGADVSTSMRTVLTWAWFRPSEKAWGQGARWYRCDVVGGSDTSTSLLDLPDPARGLLDGRPEDRWMACVAAISVAGAPRIPCSRPHRWRAVTTIKLGEPDDAYPGDRVSEVKTRDYCSDSVAAWLDYPVDYGYAYTWFPRAEWDAGNRRSVCWARTTQ